MSGQKPGRDGARAVRRLLDRPTLAAAVIGAGASVVIAVFGSIQGYFAARATDESTQKTLNAVMIQKLISVPTDEQRAAACHMLKAGFLQDASNSICNDYHLGPCPVGARTDCAAFAPPASPSAGPPLPAKPK